VTLLPGEQPPVALVSLSIKGEIQYTGADAPCSGRMCAEALFRGFIFQDKYMNSLPSNRFHCLFIITAPNLIGPGPYFSDIRKIRYIHF